MIDFIGGLMDFKKAYVKLRKAKIEALANNTNIVVGRLELNKALEALEEMINDDKKVKLNFK